MRGVLVAVGVVGGVAAALACAPFAAVEEQPPPGDGGVLASDGAGPGTPDASSPVVAEDGGCVDYVPGAFAVRPDGVTGVDVTKAAVRFDDNPTAGAIVERRIFHEITLPGATTLADYKRIKLIGTFTSATPGGFASWTGDAYVPVMGIIAGTMMGAGDIQQIATFLDGAGFWVGTFPAGPNNTGSADQKLLRPSLPTAATETSFVIDVPLSLATGTAKYGTTASIDLLGVPPRTTRTITVYIGGSSKGPTKATQITASKLCVALVP